MRKSTLLLVAALSFVGAAAHATLKPVDTTKVELYRGLVQPAFEDAIRAGLTCQGDLLVEAADYTIEKAQDVAVDQSGGQPAFQFTATWPAFDNGVSIEEPQRDIVFVTTSTDGKSVNSAKIVEYKLVTVNTGTLANPHMVSTWTQDGSSDCAR